MITSESFTQSKTIKSLEAEINLLNQKLLDKDKQLRVTEIKLQRQEKLASLGMLTAEIFHDLKNIISLTHSSLNATLIRLEEMEKTVEEARIYFDLDNDEFDYFFAKVSTNLIPGSKKSLKDIDNKIERMTELAQKVNKYLEAKETISENDFLPTDINAIITECANFACQAGQEKKRLKGEENLNLNLNIDISPSIGRVKTHQENLRRILINLIDNAFYAVYEKSQNHDESYCPTISISAEKLEDQSVAISVEDNGNGIEIGFWEAMKPLTTTKPKGEGTGLGLSIVQKLCTESKIKLKGSTEPGSNTKFNLIFEPVIA